MERWIFEDGVAAGLLYILQISARYVAYAILAMSLFRESGENTLVMILLGGGWCWLIMTHEDTHQNDRSLVTKLGWLLLVIALVWIGRGELVVLVLVWGGAAWLFTCLILERIVEGPSRPGTRRGGGMTARDVALAGRDDHDDDDECD